MRFAAPYSLVFAVVVAACSNSSPSPATDAGGTSSSGGSSGSGSSGSGGGSSGASSGGSGSSSGSAPASRFVGTWSGCTFTNRLSYTTPAGRPDDVFSPTGTVDVTSPDGLYKLSAAPSTTPAGPFCTLTFTIPQAANQAVAPIDPGQTCTFQNLQLSFDNAPGRDIDVSTGSLVGAMRGTLQGSVETDAGAVPATGSFVEVLDCPTH